MGFTILGGFCGSKLDMNTRPRSSPPEHCTAAMIDVFTSSVSELNVVARQHCSTEVTAVIT